MIKLDKEALLKAEDAAFRWAVIEAVNQLIGAVNTGVVWDNKVSSDRADEALDVKIEDVNATQSISFVTLAEAGQIDAVTASEHIEQFEEWKHSIKYEVGQLRQYEGILYKCIQEHTSQADWTPDAAVSLWDNAANPAEEWPQWSQPIGAHDAYALGDKVTYNEQHYISTVDNNVWQPDVYGWELVTEA